jgi:cytochrome c
VKKLVVLATAGLLGFAAAASAQEDLGKKYGCVKCHAVDSKKKGPSIKKIQADFKKGGITADKGVAKFKEVHEKDDAPAIKTDADIKAVLDWMLAQ